MIIAPVSSAREPLGEINTTPLIDVLLVLLVMIVVTVPLSTHSLELTLPGKIDVGARPDPVRNLLTIDRHGGVSWNWRRVGDAELAGLLFEVRAMRPEPEVQFRPEPDASYERSAQVLRMVKASRITNFGFLDHERHRSFGRAP